jgi:cell division protein FtsQ
MNRRASTPMPLPLDVRLMNGVATLLVLVFALMAAGAMLTWLVRQPVFQIKAIEVRGDVTHNNAVTLRANVAPRISGNFFTLDLARTRAAFESVPWVRAAVVQREFPDRLRVSLQEHEALAFWGPDEDSRLVNTYGEVFEVNQGDLENDQLPLLNGPLGQAPVVLQTYRLVAPLFERIDATLGQLELTGRGSWRARLDGGAVLEMGQGTPEEIQARTQRFVATVGQTSSKFGRDLESADLRYSNGYALKLRGVTTPGLDMPQDKKTR